jgi:hypothetical protein
MIEHVYEIIGNMLSNHYPIKDSKGSDSIKAVNKLLNLVKDAYVLVQWPESQELMEEDWFKEEAILDVDAKFGSSAYFIPLKRLL